MLYDGNQMMPCKSTSQRRLNLMMTCLWIIMLLLQISMFESLEEDLPNSDKSQKPENFVGRGYTGEKKLDDYEQTARHFVRTIEDPKEILEVMNMSRNSGGYVIDDFSPLPFPAEFAVYDVNGDGLITIYEMIDVTGEAENMELAFEATDINRDGLVTRAEFKLNPWGVDVT